MEKRKLDRVKIVLFDEDKDEKNGIYINGRRVPGVQKVTISAGVNLMSTVSLEFLSDKFEVEGDFKVEVKKSKE